MHVNCLISHVNTFALSCRLFCVYITTTEIQILSNFMNRWSFKVLEQKLSLKAAGELLFKNFQPSKVLNLTLTVSLNAFTFSLYFLNPLFFQFFTVPYKATSKLFLFPTFCFVIVNFFAVTAAVFFLSNFPRRLVFAFLSFFFHLLYVFDYSKMNVTWEKKIDKSQTSWDEGERKRKS